MIYLVCLIIVLLSIILFIKDQQYRHPNYPPGPKWLPIVGNTLLIKKLSKTLGGQHRAFSYLAMKYNTNVLGLKLGSDHVVVVLSGDVVREVFSNVELQVRPATFFNTVRSMFTNKGITMTNGPLWSEQKNFALRHLKQLGLGKNEMETLIIEELEDLLGIIETERSDSDILSHLSLFVLNVLWALVAGERFSHSDSHLQNLMSVFNERRAAFDMAGGFLNQMPWLRHVAPGITGFSLMCQVNEQLSRILKEIIEQHRQTLHDRKSNDFIYAFLDEMEAQQNRSSTTFTDDQLLMVCVDLFIAGAETTSNTLAFALIAMVLNPDIQGRVRAEIISVLGTREIPSIADKNKMPYVQAVLLESQRLMHVVPVAGPRYAPCDTFIDRYFIPKGTIILSSLVSIHHDNKVWKEPNVFRPERFLNRTDLQECLLQFGFGKRRCLGEVLAKNFIFIFFTGIIKNYFLRSVPGKDPPSLDPIPGITLAPKPCHIRFDPI